MTLPFPPDRPASLNDALRRFFVGSQVPGAASDDTAVRQGMPPAAQTPPPTRTIGPAMPAYAHPASGVYGALLSAGQMVDRGLHQLRQHPLATAAEVTGVPSMYRGLRDNDLSSVVRGAVQAAPFIGWAGRGLGALGAMAPAAEGAGVASAAGAASGSEEMLRNLMETGFAGGKASTMVELPAAGAGRAGSTATAMAAARRMMSPAELRSLVNAEIARRGGATSPEVEMAATEEVARHLASHGPGLLSSMQ